MIRMFLAIALGWLPALDVDGGEINRFSVATYNVDNFRLVPTKNRSARSLEDRQLVARVIKDAGVDILALQELGSKRALEALQRDLRDLGLWYPFSALNVVEQQEIYCGVLSRFPIVAKIGHSEMAFSLYGREFRVLRGLLRVDIEVKEGFRISLINVHLKSKLPVWFADQQDFRLAEAKTVRTYLDSVLSESPANLLVVGDLNDGPKSRTVRALIGRGQSMLYDARPSEPVSGFMRHSSREIWKRGVAWTHHYASADQYLRYDYLLIGRFLKRWWDPLSAVIKPSTHSGAASDHRLVQTSFNLPE